MDFTLMESFCIILIILGIGDIVSARTKAFVPSVFVAAILFLAGFGLFFLLI